jgi:hypothetical protein
VEPFDGAQGVPEGTTRLHDEIYRLTLEQGDAVGDADLDRLLLLLSRRGALIARLPRAEERPRQIAEMDRVTEARLLCWQERVVAELGMLQRGEIALNGYRADMEVRSSFLDETS